MDKKKDFKDIIQGCLQHKKASQETLFKYFYSKMMTVCLRYTSDRDMAQELLQNSFIKIFDKLNRYEDTGSFEGWVKRIVVNTCIDYYRKNKVQPSLLNEDIPIHDNDELLENIEISDESLSDTNTQIILKAVSELSPAYRTIFNLYVMEEYSHKEIAQMLGISEGTSKSNLAKAKANLQKSLKNKLKKNY